MRIVESINQSETSVISGLGMDPVADGNTAPAIDTPAFSHDQTHNVQLARQVKANLSSLEDAHLRIQFMLREVSGIVRKS